MVFEDVSGFGKTPIQSFLRHEFKIICDEEGTQFTRPGGSVVKTRPLVDPHGHQSERLKDSLREGRLLHIQLIDYLDDKLKFDEQRYVKGVRRDLSLSVKKELPHGETLTFLERIKAWAFSNGFESMRVRWRTDDSSKPQTAQVDTSRTDAGEALFVKSDEISLSSGLPEISAKLSSELVKKMKNLVE